MLISSQGLLNAFTSEPILNLRMRRTYLINAEPKGQQKRFWKCLISGTITLKICAALWEFHQQIKLKFDMVIIIWLWDPYLFLWHGNKSPTLHSIWVKKEMYKFTKDSSLIDWRLDLILFGKWKAYFNPLVDVI